MVRNYYSLIEKKWHALQCLRTSLVQLSFIYYKTRSFLVLHYIAIRDRSTFGIAETSFFGLSLPNYLRTFPKARQAWLSISSKYWHGSNSGNILYSTKTMLWAKMGCISAKIEKLTLSVLLLLLLIKNQILEINANNWQYLGENLLRMPRKTRFTHCRNVRSSAILCQNRPKPIFVRTIRPNVRPNCSGKNIF